MQVQLFTLDLLLEVMSAGDLVKPLGFPWFFSPLAIGFCLVVLLVLIGELIIISSSAFVHDLIS